MKDNLGNELPEYPTYLIHILVYSNLIYFFASLILLFKIKQFYTLLSEIIYEWIYSVIDCIILCIVSSFHHQCDNSIQATCVISNDILGFLDDYYSVWIISSIINIHLWDYPNLSMLHRAIMWLLTVLLFIFNYSNIDAYTFIIPIIIINFIVVIFTRETIRWTILVLSALFIIAARILKSFDSKDKYSGWYTNMNKYVLYHSLWHLLSGLSIICCILSIKLS